MTSINYVFRNKHYHPDRKRLAKLRSLYWVLIRRHETELCGFCGGPVHVVWWCFDNNLWIAVNRGYGGSLCIPCFDELAKDISGWMEWVPTNMRHIETPVSSRS